MISNLHDARYKRVTEQLYARVVARCNRYRGISAKLIAELDDLLVDFRKEARLKGVDLPELVAVPIVEVGAVEVLPRRLSAHDISYYTTDWRQKYPNITDIGIAAAIYHAFPEHRVQPVPVGRASQAQVPGPLQQPAANEAPPSSAA